MRFGKLLAGSAVASALALSSGYAHANFIDGAATGLASPAATINFTSPVLAIDTVVTNQFAGVTFGPSVFFNPQSGFGLTPNTVGNFSSGGAGPVNPVTLTFASGLSSVAFQFAADVTPYTFTALLNGHVVDSGTTTVGFGPPSLFYGFTGDDFNQIEITQAGAGGGPFWLLADLELGSAVVTSVPEPGTLTLLGAGLLAFAFYARRRRV